MNKAKIFINECAFTGSEDTITEVIAAIESAGFVYDKSTEGWESESFRNNLAY